ncbi:MAG: tricorn protease [Verrucomicrobiota bacterium]|jgi:hypothetical protein|nr:tricorn protease [Verrucomicrobiota bacterium]
MFNPASFLLATKKPPVCLLLATILVLSAAISVRAETSLAALGLENNPLWLRYPAISPDGKTIAFSFRGHIFTVPTAGGLAVPLTDTVILMFS